ncbi:MAG: PHP domain-containing protein [Deltaproteobacteria bacterium]|nr:PHP domain-containing protein [Deltaproteobacteria bacterium]
MSPADIIHECSQRGIGLISITDHDSIDCQEEARILCRKSNIHYIPGLELSVSFSHPKYGDSKPISLDFLAYMYDIKNTTLINKLEKMRQHRIKRAEQILEKINHELALKGKTHLTNDDMEEIQNSVDGAFGRPHIASYLVKKGIVNTRQEAFDIYLVKCNVPKLPLTLPEASEIIKNAGGKLLLAHPNHPRGTSLINFTTDITEQQKIIKETMMPYINGIECWHSEHDKITSERYSSFAKEMGLMVSGGSDCHQDPVRLGETDVPLCVANQFGIKLNGKTYG